ncbi:MAG: transcription elongation factor GreA [marine actinobacterium MedAcidi-G2B]|nr:MAG: transcription elongation factor GreA [marine actinobacterium MedAcidi-G2B]|tara:strand:+ start:7773 stop:8246 length:474 start_codon:yes stop_codon:yes gene_type:complete
MSKMQQLSQNAYDRLVAELADLTTRGRIDIARKIEAARELGDLSENGDYHAAKEEKGKMEGRIMHIESVLENCEIIAEIDVQTDVVSPGVTVSILYEGDETPELLLVGSIEEKRDDIDVVSPGSPLGEALLGGKAGDIVSFEAPHGVLKVEIVSIGN